MKYLIFIYASLLSQISSAQQIGFSILPETLKRNQFDISAAIPFKDGLLTTVMESDGKDEKYIIKLGLIKPDKNIQKSIDIGFRSEAWMKLIGIYLINKRPVIMYSTRITKQNELHIKAVLINPETLKIEAVKEVAVFNENQPKNMPVIESNADAGWLDALEIQPSQDSTRYFINYEINDQHNFVVFDDNANVLYRRAEKFPDGSRNLSVCLSKRDKLLIFYNLADVPGNTEYKNDFKSFIRSIDLSISKSTDIPIDKSIGNIRKIRILFKNGQAEDLHLLGIYSESFSDEDIAGALHLSFNTTTESTTLIAKKELPYDIKSSSLFPDYFMTAGPQRESYPLFERLIFSYCDWANDDEINLAVEYLSFSFPAISFQSIINFHFRGKEITATPIEKKQVAPEDNAFNYCGSIAVAYKNKLIFIFNDNSENLVGDKKPREFNPLAKESGNLVAVVVDEKGEATKQELYGKFEKNDFAELLYAQSIGPYNQIMRISKHDTRNKEFKLGIITIN